MGNELKPFYRVIGYLVMVHLLCLLAMMLCRIVLLVGNMPEAGIDWSLLPTAIVIGIKFDNLIASYVSALPFVVLPVLSICLLHKSSYNQWMLCTVHAVEWYYGLLYALILFIGVANARYYTFFDNHLNISVTEWFGFVGDTAGLVFGDYINWIYTAIAVLLIAVYMVGLKSIGKRYINTLRS